ncbi:MAG: DUF2812 domain-containing protein [Gudongella sp.]|nr:DUF2812 domain-containing protein [Gudongella sp.]
MNDKKIIIDALTPKDYEILETRFNTMANEGLLIDKMKFRMSFYKRIQPKNIQFAVGIYPKAKAFDSPNEKMVAEYIKAQKEKGWDHIFSQEYTHVFMNEDGEVIEDIDRTNQVENIKSILKPEIFGLVFAVLINVFGLIMNLDIGIYHFRSNFALLSLFFLPALIIAATLYLIYDIFRYIRISRIENNDEIQIEDINGIVLLKKIWSVFVTIFFLILPAGIIADSLIGGSRVFLLLLPVIFLFFLAYKLRDFFPEIKMGTTAKTMLALLGVFLVALAISTEGIFSINGGVGIELPEKYYALKLKEVGIEEDPEEISFKREGSILIPLSYTYGEKTGTRYINPISVHTQVDKALNKDLADYFFKLNLESSTRYIGEFVSAKDYYINFDGAYFVSFLDGEIAEVKLKKDEYIFSFSGDFDLKEPGNIDLIYDMVDKVISNLN